MVFSRVIDTISIVFIKGSKSNISFSHVFWCIHKSYIFFWEHILHFILCIDPPWVPQVRVYTPKRLIQELEAAKEEYIRATFGVRKDQKILLPKIIESFAKDSGLCPAGVMEMVQQCLPESFRRNIKKFQTGKSRKIIEWVPHNFAFRYLIFRDLIKWSSNL